MRRDAHVRGETPHRVRKQRGRPRVNAVLNADLEAAHSCRIARRRRRGHLLRLRGDFHEEVPDRELAARAAAHNPKAAVGGHDHRGEDAPGAPREEIQIEAEEPLARSNARALLHVQLEALPPEFHAIDADRKSTRLNSSHSQISYAVFCLKKKKRITTNLYYLNG